jgi:hypothetical protein
MKVSFIKNKGMLYKTKFFIRKTQEKISLEDLLEENETEYYETYIGLSASVKRTI